MTVSESQALPTTQTELVTSAGDWTRSSRERCWDAQGAGLVNMPAFSYAGEKLSIVARTPNVITLRGIGTGYRETDTIDAVRALWTGDFSFS